MASAAVDHLEGIGTVLKPGLALTICQPEVHGIQTGSTRKLIANGQQTLIRAQTKQ